MGLWASELLLPSLLSYHCPSCQHQCSCPHWLTWILLQTNANRTGWEQQQFPAQTHSWPLMRLEGRQGRTVILTAWYNHPRSQLTAEQGHPFPGTFPVLSWGHPHPSVTTTSDMEALRTGHKPGFKWGQPKERTCLQSPAQKHSLEPQSHTSPVLL